MAMMFAELVAQQDLVFLLGKAVLPSSEPVPPERKLSCYIVWVYVMLRYSCGTAQNFPGLYSSN